MCQDCNSNTLGNIQDFKTLLTGVSIKITITMHHVFWLKIDHNQDGGYSNLSFTNQIESNAHKTYNMSLNLCQVKCDTITALYWYEDNLRINSDISQYLWQYVIYLWSWAWLRSLFTFTTCLITCTYTCSTYNYLFSFLAIHSFVLTPGSEYRSPIAIWIHFTLPSIAYDWWIHYKLPLA